ncbi:proline-rich protein 1-like [Dorcoceras hygrometricum]|uniref:Proline-rich protein 1-like n=1 Tax=Dorcoceras hygrometricum TaxID=472368 RepID=A0A2Z7CR35_9LAMI|nr:proline-rich protein 1-like [Dorcoceras hygrometricum]
MDQIGDFYRNLPRRSDVIVTTVGARHKCQQGGAELPETCSFDCYQLESLRQRFEGSRKICVLVEFPLQCVVPEKSNAIIGVVTVGFECLPPSCDGLTGPDDHGSMISDRRFAVRDDFIQQLISLEPTADFIQQLISLEPTADFIQQLISLEPTADFIQQLISLEPTADFIQQLISLEPTADFIQQLISLEPTADFIQQLISLEPTADFIQQLISLEPTADCLPNV